MNYLGKRDRAKYVYRQLYFLASSGVFWQWWRWHKNCNISMNMESWRLLRQGIGRNPLGKRWEKFWGYGLVESNFIINFHVFLDFLVLEAILKY